MRHSVEFFAATDRLAAEGYNTFLEISPSAILGESIKETLRVRGVLGTVLASARRGHEERLGLLAAAAVHQGAHPLSLGSIKGKVLT